MAAPLIAKALAAKASRRAVMRSAGVGVVGALFAIAGTGAATATLAAVLGGGDDLELGPPSADDGPVGANGWAWPSAQRGIAQGFHDGFSIDLVTADGGPLYAPFAGVVVKAGGDGGPVPGVCRVIPSWWRGENSTVIIQHNYNGRTLYSSHNHIRPGSPASLGIMEGVAVRAGQTVALSGMSGCTSGPHTHFTLASTNRNYNPDVNPFLFIGNP
ncbi:MULTISPECIES: M23 family metallopeptidase [unclassified Leucobacter]|uniref:M23 family metallopeptidase n=1 Tax=unclassified Leucobacter TaxID=2621730 RepID=UPI00301A3A39